MDSSRWDPSDARDAEEALFALESDLTDLKKYKRKIEPFVARMEAIGAALETRRISAYATRIARRIADVAELELLIGAAAPLVAAFERDFERLVVEGGSLLMWPPSRAALLEHARAIATIEDRINEEDNGDHIDWTLEDFLTEEAVIQRKLERDKPAPLMEDEYLGSRGLNGVLVYYDEQYLSARIEEAE